jgi:hypothetical protein
LILQKDLREMVLLEKLKYNKWAHFRVQTIRPD